MCVGVALSRFPALWATSTPSSIVSSSPMIGVEASRSSPVKHTSRPCATPPTGGAGPDLSDDERRDDSYRSYYVALAEMRRR